MKTEIIDSKKWFSKALKKAVKELKKSNVIVVPTETSYGLAAVASDKKAVRKIYRIKNQPKNKQVSIIVPNLKTAQKYGEITFEAKRIAGKFMPGPLTLIVPSKKNAAHLGGKTIAFRISSNRFVQALGRKLKEAITATSANIHGQPDTYSGKKAAVIFEGKVSLVVDAGILPKQKPSTIFDLEKKIVVRAGKISEKQIKKVLGEK